MPPTRTFPPAKAVKTERTHEENQERLVALLSVLASRTDRILEHTLLPPEEAIEVLKLE